MSEPQQPGTPKDSPALAFVNMTPPERFHAWVASVGESAAEHEIFDYIVAGGSLHAWTKDNGFSYTAALYWIRKVRARGDAYDDARRERADINADQVVDVARRDCSAPVLDKEGNFVGTVVDKGKVAQARNEMDALRWHAARMNPRVWGDKVQVDQNINVREASDEQLARALGQFGLGTLAEALLHGGVTRTAAASALQSAQDSQRTLQ